MDELKHNQIPNNGFEHIFSNFWIHLGTKKQSTSILLDCHNITTSPYRYLYVRGDYYAKEQFQKRIWFFGPMAFELAKKEIKVCGKVFNQITFLVSISCIQKI